MEVGFWGGIHRTRVAVCGGAAWAFMAGGEGLLVRRSVWARVPQRAPHSRKLVHRNQEGLPPGR